MQYSDAQSTCLSAPATCEVIKQLQNKLLLNKIRDNVVLTLTERRLSTYICCSFNPDPPGNPKKPQKAKADLEKDRYKKPLI